MRLRDILALIVVAIITIGGQIFRDDEALPETESPRRPPPSAYNNVPWDADTQYWLTDKPTAVKPKSPAWAGIGPEAIIDIPHERKSGTGTAFTVGSGQWLTARHVIDGCDDVGLQYAPGKAVRVTAIRNHPNADVALLTTKRGPAPFEVGDDPSQGDSGFMIGFPKGNPGAVFGRKIGTTTLKERGRYRTRETADVWSERTRLPNRTGSLGGLSGGPIFTGDGRVVGVVLAESKRRGRVFTAQPETMRHMFNNSTETYTTPIPLNETDYPNTARDWLTSLQISKVLCRVKR